MKKFFTVLAVVFMAAVVMTSCKKSSEDPYPSVAELYGFWDAYRLAADNEFGFLLIEPNMGGSDATVRIYAPAGDGKTDTLVTYASGAFLYDESTGEGHIVGAFGGDQVTIYTERGSSQQFVMHITNAYDPQDPFDAVYTCSAETVVEFPYGENIWGGSVISPTGTWAKVGMKITSLLKGNCGDLEYSSSGEAYKYNWIENVSFDAATKLQSYTAVSADTLTIANFDGYGEASAAEVKFKVTGVSYFVQGEDKTYSGVFKVIPTSIPGRIDDEQIVFVRTTDGFQYIKLYHEFDNNLFISTLSRAYGEDAVREATVPESNQTPDANGVTEYGVAY